MKKWIVYILGIQLLAIGIICNTRTQLGVAAFSSIFYALSKIFGMSLGQASMILYVILIVLQVILHKRITRLILLEIPFSIVFSFVTDFYDYVIGFHDLLPVQAFLLLCAAQIANSLGVYLTVQCRIAVTPVEGMVSAISDVFHLKFSKVKNYFDLSMILITVVMCLLLRRPVYGIGVGTVISAAVVGRLISLWEKWLPLHFEKRDHQMEDKEKCS